MTLAYPRNDLTPVTTNGYGSSNVSEEGHEPKRMRLDTAEHVVKGCLNPRTSSTVHSNPPVPPITPPTQLATPLNSLKSSGKIPTMSLKLQIPRHIPDKKEKQQQTARKGAATKWARDGKLQRPMPNYKELKAAYDLKLMRHYPACYSELGPLAMNSTEIATPEPNFVKPVVQKSERVVKLLNSFPKLESLARTTTNNKESIRQRKVDHKNLRHNAKVLTSEEAGRLAWRNFSVEDPSIQRQYMIESALPEEELVKEGLGLDNKLPEWIRYKTGRFAREEQSRKRKRQA